MKQKILRASRQKEETSYKAKKASIIFLENNIQNQTNSRAAFSKNKERKCDLRISHPLKLPCQVSRLQKNSLEHSRIHGIYNCASPEESSKG